MATRSDRAVVLGANIEGLAAAATLAAAGRDVHVVDRLCQAGGAARGIELEGGHTVPGLYNETALVRSKLLAPLELEKHGLEWRSDERPLHVLRQNGEALAISRQSVSGSPDASAYREWRAFVDRLSSLIVDVLDDTPPEPTDPGVMDLFQLAKKGFKLRTLGESDMMELMRIVTMPAWDWMEERFEDPALRAGLTALALPGTMIGPRGAGTTALMLLREAARGVEPVGGLAGLVRALETRCEKLGVQFHLGCEPRRIRVDNALTPSATGLELADGHVIEGGLVLSALDPMSTLLDLVQPGLLPLHVEAEVKSWRLRGSSAVLLLALSKSVELPSSAERLISAENPTQLERAADALKYGEFPEEPWLDVRDWSRSDEGCAPEGGSTLAVHIHGVSADLAAGWSDETRGSLRDRVFEALERCVPGVRDSIRDERLLTPPDLARDFDLRGGHLYGGELVLDQLWVQRPALALARYESPIAGLFLGGAGHHPGGPFVGGAGVLAARRALRRN